MGALTKPKVLVVDDSPAMVKMVTDKLTRVGYDVIGHTQSLGIALIILRQKPDLILLDVDMPYLNGPEVCKLIKQNPSMATAAATPVIFYSGLPEEELQKHVVEAGAQGFVHKNWSTEQLLAHISACFRE